VHLKCSGVDNWGKAVQVLDKIAAARAQGCDIDCDAYPYAAGANPLKNLLPPWVQIGGNDAMLARLALPEIRTRIRSEIADHGLNNWGRIPSWGAVQISISPQLQETAGETVAALAAARACDPIDQICEHLIADRGATRVLIASICEDDIRTIVRSPTALVGSDGNCVATYGIVSQGMPHPRFYGTFPRIIGHYVRDERLIPLEQAIYKMTGGPAKALRLHDRGLLRRGIAPTSPCLIRMISATRRRMRTRTAIRAARARPSTAASSLRMQPIPAQHLASCCGAALRARSASAKLSPCLVTTATLPRPQRGSR